MATEAAGENTMPNRDEAWALLCEYTQSESLRKHALAVEAVMRAYARKQAEDQDKWGLAGLLHDFDYERYPNAPDHPLKGSEILREKGYPEDLRRAILGHAEYTGVPRDSLLAKVLFACDELTGFVTAVALVKPNKSIFEVEPRSVLKKLKDKAFARSVNRNDILNGAVELGVDLNDHIAFVIDSLKPIAREIGLEGLNTAENSAAGSPHSST
jgi:putative nucleotidyltransferase with HDIG domain